MPRAKGHIPAVLIILDGWGILKKRFGNAIAQAKTPNMDRLWRTKPHTLLEASGLTVGLPAHQAGNSEAGHLTIGAGRSMDQDSVRISASINDGTFFKNPAFVQVIKHVKLNNSRLHLIGIVSGDQSPHVDPEHLQALLMLCRQRDVRQVVLHLFTDGRDSSPRHGQDLMKKLVESLDPQREIIATVAGRYYMDRKKKWQRTQEIFTVMVDDPQRVKRAPSAEVAIRRAYKRGETDEFIKPTIIYQESVKTPRISHNDGIIFFNHRSDRARQLTKPFVQNDFKKKNPGSFTPIKKLKNIIFVAMSDFGPDLGDILTAYPSELLRETLPMALKDFRQLYIAESEKYAHITFFFNGGYDHPVAGETRLLVESPDVRTYDLTPEMSAGTIADTVVTGIESDRFDFICCNFANPDMVGHTGNMVAAKKAISYVDDSIGRISDAVHRHNGILIVCADHGNAEEMKDREKKSINTQHSKSPTPFIVQITPRPKKKLARLNKVGTLADIAPTLLTAMGVSVPKYMTGDILWR